MWRAFTGCLFAAWSSATAMAADPLPEGDEGIAASYPYDEGIGGDAAVVFVDDFEGYADPDELWDTWDNVFQLDLLRFAAEPENVWAGEQSIEMSLPQQDAELGDALTKILAPERDVLFLRYYSKFMAPFDVVGSSHNGSWISSHYEDENGQATPGIPADGTNKFLVAYENWRGEPRTMSPGQLNVYVYHPEQRDDYGDHFFPTGLVSPNTSLPYDFGPDFVSRPDVIPELDRWYCYEVMVQANTPGERDGRIAFWIDGELAADFMNLRLRDVDTLTIDRFGVGFHVHSNPSGEQKKWYDNVVAADAYIGPMFVPGAGDTGASDSTGDVPDDDGDGGDDGGDAGSVGGGGGGTSAGNAGDGTSSGGGTSSSQDDATSGGCGCVTARESRMPALALLPILLAARRRRGRSRRESVARVPF